MKENQEYPLYEDEIDLRALLETLWRRRKLYLTSLQKGDLFTTETMEITETKDKFIFRQK
jgi:hypothetical protein